MLDGTVNKPGDLVGGVDPYNMGKGDWIWQIPSAQTNTNTTNVTDLAKFLKSKGMKWIIVKAGDANDGPVTGSWKNNFNKTVIDAFHAQGIKIFGYHFTYGGVFPNGKNATTTLAGEKKVADEIMSLNPDGLIIDAEGDWERNPNANRDAEDYAKTFKQKYPNKLLGHAPFPYVSLHKAFPYLGFGKWVDVIMPQLYWKTISIAQTPEKILIDVNRDYKALYNEFAEQGHPEAIKPIVPIGQGYDPSSTKITPGAEVTRYFDLLRNDPDPASPFGYNGVSFWSVQHHSGDVWNAIGNGVNSAATGSISGTVFNDKDGDGIKDVGEAGIAGRIIWDDTDNDNKRDGYEPFATTDANGNYKLVYRPAGIHRVRQEVPGGWRQTSPSGGLSNSVSLSTAQQATGRNFGTTTLAQISGTVYNDTNANGDKDTGEGALSGRTVYLDANNNNVLDAGEVSTLTSSKGTYAFTVVGGTYHVRQITTVGYRITTPAAGFYTVNVSNGQATTKFFGNTTNVLISGFVYNDKNANGIKESGEAALKGWRVFVDLDGDGIYDNLTEPSSLTDSNGKYRINQIGGGTWRIQVFVPNGWVATVPGSAARKLTLASGGTTSNKNFGVRGIT